MIVSKEEIISFHNVSFSYGQNLVLEDVNLDIYRKESVCIVGPNGGGKTTLIKLMLGLLSPQQ
ncbi:MAG: ATP-binding cassette domain-containing protein, partial [Planctomycetes bacterium]|nr:ATP-binding cassette domain-containing protein [Planctomycetota bacterium]